MPNPNSIRRHGGHNIVNRLGQRFGRLTVIARAGSRGNNATWLCACDCGNQKIIGANCLRAGYSRSCGCSRKTGPNSRPVYTCYLEPGTSAKRYALKQYKLQAKKRGLEWALSDDAFFHLIASNCFYCGALPATMTKVSRNGYLIRNGLDRKDNAFGYIMENVMPCCPTCNHAKNDMPFEVFQAWISRLIQHRSAPPPADLLSNQIAWDVTEPIPASS